MKKWIYIMIFCIATALSGCNNDTNKSGIYEKSGNTLNVNNKRNELYNEGGAKGVRNVTNDYGYVRHQKSPVMTNNNKQYAAVDREQLANVISRLSAGIPNIHDVGTLVTDQEVLVAYRTNAKNQTAAADQVKRTAMSVVPRYYHVYVTDNKQLMRDVENLSHLNPTSKNARSQINYLIKQMKKSPQGAPMNNPENANGETKEDEMNTGTKR